MSRRITSRDGPHPIDVIVGANLKRLRMEAGMSQTATVETMGITFQQLQKYERGTNRISASKIVELSRVLGVPIMAFFEGVNSPRYERGLAYPPDRLVLEIGKLASGMTRQAREALLSIAKTFRHFN